jgi:predicted helicase
MSREPRRMTGPIKIFYVYAHEDEALRKKLNAHLSILQREGLIGTWHDQDVSPGALWADEVQRQLKQAQIILLLVSSAFLASDYLYGQELQLALKRHAAGEAVVIPVILRPVDWQAAPFAHLPVLPKQGKPVVNWPTRDAAFLDVAQGVRAMVEQLTGRTVAPEPVPMQQEERRFSSRRQSTLVAEETLVSTPAALTPSVLKKAVERYHKELHAYDGKARHETALRSAFLNLLAETAKRVNWTLIPEQTLGKIRPDGVLRDTFNFRRGYWEAKGPDSDLEKEIKKKQQDKYPLTNTIFENTVTAVLYQNNQRVFESDLKNQNQVMDLLRYFLTYSEPELETFEAAVQEFKDRIPELAQEGLLPIIDQEYAQNRQFVAAFDAFTDLCSTSLNPQIGQAEIKEMLIQHLLTERLFRTIFNNPGFVNRNVIAVEIEKVIRALTSRAFDREDFLKRLDRFYIAIESAARGLNWSERQDFLNTVYERFFQGFAVKKADTHGIVYTPQEIVDFMVASVDEVLKREFHTTLATPGVKILDPATGTGNFIVNILRRVYETSGRGALRAKYTQDLFCNEIMLLPYYIASLNIEHEYYEKMGEYAAFEGVCFADTLELAESQQLSFFVPENTERVEREKAAEIMVVIGNPPYNVGQKNENDQNKNRKYPVLDENINKTYVRSSNATNKNKLYDAYVRFFRWATDRLGERDGIVCYVTNNSFVEQIAFDGMRKYLLQDFSQIYHIDLHGNVRKNPKLSGTTHNVFGIQVGVGITIAIKSARHTQRQLYYYRVPEDWTKEEKLGFLINKHSLKGVEWMELQQDERYTWITEGLKDDFQSYPPMGSKEARAIRLNTAEAAMVKTIFKTYSLGVRTNRDDWAYNFDQEALKRNILRFAETYNAEADRWHRRGSETTSVNDFVTYDDKKIKWSRDLLLDLQRKHYVEFFPQKTRNAMYRPFSKKWLFFDRILNEEVYQFPQIFPHGDSEKENILICLTDLGSEKPFMTIVSSLIPDLHLVGAGAGTQCFPYYTYAADGTNRRENITDWALEQFQSAYGGQVTKWQIFHYIYAMLHHPQYRERYAENLKRDLPRIPLLKRVEGFARAVEIGRELMELHLNYEQAKEYPLRLEDNGSLPYTASRRVEKMRLTPDRSSLVVNQSLTFHEIPQEVYRYRLGNRSALEWIIDQYQVSTDPRSGITSDPNRLDDDEYILRLVCQIVTVSLRTVQLVDELAQAVKLEDWLTPSNAEPPAKPEEMI